MGSGNRFKDLVLEMTKLGLAGNRGRSMDLRLEVLKFGLGDLPSPLPSVF